MRHRASGIAAEWRSSGVFFCLPLLLLGCWSSRSYLGSAAFRSYDDQSGVRVEARFFVNSADLFGASLAADGVVPIEVTIAVREGAPSSVELARSEADLLLLLPDGTTLDWIPAEEVFTGSPEMDDVIEQRALRFGIVDPGERRTGFIFFRKRDQELDWEDEGRVTVPVAGVPRTMSASESLLLFGLLLEGEQKLAFRLGVEPRIWLAVKEVS